VVSLQCLEIGTAQLIQVHFLIEKIVGSPGDNDILTGLFFPGIAPADLYSLFPGKGQLGSGMFTCSSVFGFLHHQDLILIHFSGQGQGSGQRSIAAGPLSRPSSWARASVA